jgi:hypothetical protein
MTSVSPRTACSQSPNSSAFDTNGAALAVSNAYSNVWAQITATSNAIPTSAAQIGGVTGTPWTSVGYLTNLSGAVTNVVFTNAEPSVSPYVGGLLLIGTNTPAGGLTNGVAATNNLGYVTNINGTLYIGTGIVAGVTGAITNNQTGVTLTGTFSGNLAGATNIPLTGLQIAPLTNNQGAVTLTGTTTVSNLTVNGYTTHANGITITGSTDTNQLKLVASVI